MVENERFKMMASGATIGFDGATFTFTSASSVSGAGTAEVGSATVNVAGTWSSTTQLDGAGSLNFSASPASTITLPAAS